MIASYSEAAYFDGAHVQHIADWQEHRRLKRHFEIAPEWKLYPFQREFLNTLRYRK